MKKLVIIATLIFSGLLMTNAVSAKGLNTKAEVSQTMSKVNINRAGAKEIAQVLTGIGSKKAQAIVAYRTKHGVFKSAEDLAAVKGIGVLTIERNHNKIAL